jgi:hypothetical protein
VLEFYLSVDVTDTTRPILPREQDNCREFWSRMIYRKEKDIGCLSFLWKYVAILWQKEA